MHALCGRASNAATTWCYWIKSLADLREGLSFSTVQKTICSAFVQRPTKKF